MFAGQYPRHSASGLDERRSAWKYSPQSDSPLRLGNCAEEVAVALVLPLLPLALPDDADTDVGLTEPEAESDAEMGGGVSDACPET